MYKKIDMFCFLGLNIYIMIPVMTSSVAYTLLSLLFSNRDTPNKVTFGVVQRVALFVFLEVGCFR